MRLDDAFLCGFASFCGLHRGTTPIDVLGCWNANWCLPTIKENDMLSNAAYDTTVEGYYDQIQDLFFRADSGSSLLFRLALAGAERHHCAVGEAHYLRIR
jgi:hypothetical protein